MFFTDSMSSPFHSRGLSRIWDGTHVVVTWVLLDATPGVSVEVLRSEFPGARPVRIEAPDIVSTGDRFVFRDRTAERGKTYTYQVSIIENGIPVTFFETSVSIPVARFALEQNHPNPFNPVTTIRFTMPASGQVKVAVYDANGRLVKTLLDEVRSSGPNAVEWDGTNSAGRSVGSGVYFYRLSAGNLVQTRKMTLLK